MNKIKENSKITVLFLSTLLFIVNLSLCGCGTMTQSINPCIEELDTLLAKHNEITEIKLITIDGTQYIFGNNGYRMSSDTLIFNGYKLRNNEKVVVHKERILEDQIFAFQVEGFFENDKNEYMQKGNQLQVIMKQGLVIDGELISVNDSNLTVLQSSEIEGTQIMSPNLIDTLYIKDIKTISVFVLKDSSLVPILMFAGGGLLGAAIAAATVESDEWDELLFVKGSGSGGISVGMMKVILGAGAGLIIGGIAALIYKSETSVNEMVFEINEYFDSESLKPYARH